MKKLLTFPLLFPILFVYMISACTVEKNTAAKNKVLIKTRFEQWVNSENSFFDLLAEDVEWKVIGEAPYSGIYNGKDEFIKKAVVPITSKLKTNIEPELISITAENNVVWLHWKGHAITITNESYDNEYAWMLEMKNDSIIKATAFLDTYGLSKLENMQETRTIEETKEYLGMWVTEDGTIRHELLPNNRYDEARGDRKSAYQGKYWVTGNHIDYKDDTGFTADGEFKDGVLYHAGMVLYKEN